MPTPGTRKPFFIASFLLILLPLFSGYTLIVKQRDQISAISDSRLARYPQDNLQPQSTPQPNKQDQRSHTVGKPTTGLKPIIQTSAAGVSAVFSLPERIDPGDNQYSLLSPADWRVVFQDGFENDLSKWDISDNSTDNLERQWGLDDFYVYNGEGSLWVASGGTDAVDPQSTYYPHNMDTWLVTASALDLTNANLADFEFFMRYETEPEWDYIFVGVSLDGQEFSGEWWSGDSDGWQYFDLDLSDYIGQPEIYIGWYFHSDSFNYDDVGFEGVWIDDIAVWFEDSLTQASDSVQNGDFELGDLWYWQQPDYSTVERLSAENPNGGEYVAYFGGIQNAKEQLYQRVILPDEDITSASFDFWVNQFGRESKVSVDTFCAELRNDDLSKMLVDVGCLDGVESISDSFDPAGWLSVKYPLSGEEWDKIRGQTVNVVFEMETDWYFDTTVYIDDVTFEIVTGGSGGDILEPNNFYEEATRITLPVELTNLTIDPIGDFDYFSFDASAGDTIAVDVDAVEIGSLLDSYIWLDNESGDTVCENDDDGLSTDSYLTCHIPADGTYYVVVSSYDGSGDRNQSYTLNIDQTAIGETTPPPPPSPTPTQEPTPDPDQANKWTAMLYLVGDNNLCDTYPQLISRMEQELGPNLDDFLTVTVLFDRDPRYCGNGNTTRYVIQPNGQYTDNVNRWNLREVNMGDPNTLIDFATWSMDNFPAEHYYLAIDDHGGGISGVAWDETNYEDNLSNDELYAALKQITQNGSRKIDLFAFEACLMGLYENSYDLKEFTDYIFAFPTISWSSEASYPSYLSHPDFDGTTTGGEFGDIMFDIYYESVGEPHYYAQSLVESGKMNAVQGAVNDWAITLLNEVGSNKASLEIARRNAQKIDTNVDNQITEEDANLDLWDLVDKMAAQGIAEQEGRALQQAIAAAVMRSAQRSDGDLDYEDTHGLSIYWPLTASGGYGAYVDGQIYNSTRDGAWDEFLTAFFGESVRAGLPVDMGPAERQQTKRSLLLPIIMR
jgi:hypothetical protein